LTAAQKKARTAEAEKPFNEKMEKVREGAMKYASVKLTLEEVNAIVPTVGFDDEGNEIKTAKQLAEEAKEAAFVPPRVVTEKGFPVSKAGMEKFIEINEEVDKHDPDMHDM
jgi:formyltetrahydrofolate synthetase